VVFDSRRLMHFPLVELAMRACVGLEGGIVTKGVSPSGEESNGAGGAPCGGDNYQVT